MTVACTTSMNHPAPRIVRLIETTTDRIHAPGDDDLRAAGFTVRAVPGWFGLLTHREISRKGDFR